MLSSWRSRNMVFSLFFLILVGGVVVCAWLMSFMTSKESKGTYWLSQMMLSVSAWTIFWTVIYAIPPFRRQILFTVTVCLGIFTQIAWLFFAIWSCVPAATCKHHSYCKFYKLLCGFLWIETVLLLVVICFPPNFQIIWRRLYDDSVACFVRLRRLRLHLRQRFQALQDIFPGTFRCSICMEDHRTASAARFAPCRHPFCKECAAGFISAQVEEQTLPILCPLCMTETERAAKKIGALDDFLLGRIKLSSDQNAALSDLKMASFSVLVDCPHCERSTYVAKEKYHASKIVSCPSPGCQYTWCKSCVWATETDNAEAKQHSCDGAIELRDLMAQQGWRYCPGCRTPTERISGCNHMTCKAPGCFTHFCYPCGEAVPTSGFAAHNKRCMRFGNNGGPLP